MHQFNLEKWYMDAADTAGQAFIGYAAKLKWGPINLFYSGFTYLNGDPKKPALKRNSFKLRYLPEVKADKLSWHFMQAEGSWIKIDNTLEEYLYSSDEGDIIWTCLYPKSLANVTLHEGSISNAFGYVEKIVLTIPAWKIPIAQIRWGRYLTIKHTILWIKWSGPIPRSLVYFNGKRITDAEISEKIVKFDEYELVLTDSKALRRGSLLSTVFLNFPSLIKLFPRSTMAIRENRWLSQGTLVHNNQQIETTKVIHHFVILE
jgi:hypothetical protein